MHVNVQLVYDKYIRIKSRNCHVINFCYCNLVYCIEFTKFTKKNHLLLSVISRFLYLLFLNNVVVLVAYVIVIVPIVWISKSIYLDIYIIY